MGTEGYNNTINIDIIIPLFPMCAATDKNSTQSCFGFTLLTQRLTCLLESSHFAVISRFYALIQVRVGVGQH